MNVEEIQKKWESNPFAKPRIEKVVVHSCAGSAGQELERTVKILERLTGKKPKISKAKRRIQQFGISRGMPIAAQVTLRKNEAIDFLKKALTAKEFKLSRSSVDKNGNISFGIKDHLAIPGTKYDPEVGSIGFDVNVCVRYPGAHVIYKKIKRAKKIKNVSPEETIYLFEKEFGVKFE